jgi:acetyl esterase/lipase
MAILPAASTLPALISTINAVFYQDIPYRNNPSGRCKLDFYKPKGGASSKPIVIYVHGGAYMGGDKINVYNVATYRAGLVELIDNDIAVISVNYRLLESDGTETAGVRKCMADGIVAVQQILFNATELGIDKTKLGYWGNSAGAGVLLFLCGKDRASDSTSHVGTRNAESTRPIVAGFYRPQHANIPRFAEYHDGIEFSDILSNASMRALVYQFYGMPDTETPALSDFETVANRSYAAALDMNMNYISSGITLYLENPGSLDNPTDFDTLVHHPDFALELHAIATGQAGTSSIDQDDPPSATLTSLISAVLNA